MDSLNLRSRERSFISCSCTDFKLSSEIGMFLSTAILRSTAICRPWWPRNIRCMYIARLLILRKYWGSAFRMIISLALTVALNLNPSALVRKSMLSPTGGHAVGPFRSLWAFMNRLNSFTMRLVSTIFSWKIFRTMILRSITFTDG